MNDLIKRLRYPTPSSGSKHIKVLKVLLCLALWSGGVALLATETQLESVYTKMFESTIIFKVLYYTKTPVKMCKPKHRLGSFISFIISIGLQEVLNTSLDHCFISFINICIGLQEVLQGQLGCKIAEAQNRKD